jgi:hypothetical protein
MQFGIAMGMRRDDEALRNQVQQVLDARAGDIRAILVRYGVPLVSSAPHAGAPGGAAP